MTGPQLLLLDNDHRIVELLSWFLRERGFGVRTAASFGEARAAIGDARPDLLISDVDLGAESAVQELPRLSAEGLLPPTLVVSGYLDAAVQERLDAVPEVLDTLSKPFEFTDLEARVALCLERVAAGLPVAPAPPRAAPPESAPPGSAPSGATRPDPAGLDDEDDEGWIEISPRG